tara:strand:+ start:950 stop:1132 length:183 start_codon:yes stop_codon:yes gene_type:complete
MVSFARARTRSWLSKLLPLSVQPSNKKRTEFYKAKELIEKQLEENKSFLAASKNGGIWFS